MASSIPEVEWHQNAKLIQPPHSRLPNAVWVLVGMARNRDTKERIGSLYIAPIGTPVELGTYPPSPAWVALKESEEDTYTEPDEEVIEPADKAEMLRKMVADQLATTDTYVDWVTDQVDGSLQDVVDAVLAAYSEYKMRQLNEITDPRASMEEEARLP